MIGPFKRGSTYGTVLVDLETRRAVDLLPDRRAETLAAWLRPRRRRIKVVARDRSTEFARGVSLGAPRAVQVADRWHLLQNTREMLTRWLFTVYGRLRRLPPVGAQRTRCRRQHGQSQNPGRLSGVREVPCISPRVCRDASRWVSHVLSRGRIRRRHERFHR